MSGISGSREYFPDSHIALDHFHVIKMMNDIPDRGRSKEARNNETLKHISYDWLKNSHDLTDRERDSLMSGNPLKRHVDGILEAIR